MSDSIEINQNYIDSVYDEQNDNETKQFEEFLKHREPPTEPEMIGDMKNRLKESNIQKENINDMLKKQSDNIKLQAEELEKKDDFVLDDEYVERNENFFKRFLNYTTTWDYDMNICNIMHEWTNFKYSPYGELRTNYIKSPAERLLCINKLGKIFDYNFITFVNKTNYRFDTLSFEICKYIGELEDEMKTPTVFEHKFIKNMLSKLLICMLSNVDRAFSNKKVQLNINFKKAVQSYLNEFSYIIKGNDRISNSWKVFESNLLLSSFNSQIFVYNGYNDLREKIIECLRDEKDFMMEQLIANTLKTYIPTIAYSYFHVIKNIYIIARLLSIYVNKKLFKDKNKKEIENDLYIIVSSLTLDYEVNYFANINTRTTPSYKYNELSKQTEMYYINHLIAGPQYFILKQLELSLPTLSTSFSQCL